MKKILIVLVLTQLIDTDNLNAQVPDTLAYLQSIVADKSKFIGKPFAVLADSLKIQIKFFSPFASIAYDTHKETSTQFSFRFPQNENEIYLMYPSLRISWKSYLNTVQSDSLYLQYRSVGWSPAVAAFYSNGIIADIKIRE
jgi:hypothetical protein